MGITIFCSFISDGLVTSGIVQSLIEKLNQLNDTVQELKGMRKQTDWERKWEMPKIMKQKLS